MKAEHDAITRALDNYDIFMRDRLGMEVSALARAQLDALLEENARLREALSDVVNACGNDGERIKDDEFFKVMDRIASAHAKARALLAPEEKTDGE